MVEEISLPLIPKESQIKSKEWSEDQLNQAKGMIYGMALGDILGQLKTQDTPLTRYLEQNRIKALPTNLRFSPDFELALLTIEAITRESTSSIDKFMNTLLELSKQWLVKAEKRDDTSIPFKVGIRHWVQGTHWLESGVEGSKGSEALLRVLPVTWFFNEFPGRRRVYSRAITATSHRNPIVLESATLFGELLNIILQYGREGIKDVFLKRLDSASPVFKEQAVQIRLTLDRIQRGSNAIQALELLGNGRTVQEMLSLITVLMIINNDQFLEPFTRSLHFSGYGRVLATLIGGVAGVEFGFHVLEKVLLNNLPVEHDLNLLSKELVLSKKAFLLDYIKNADKREAGRGK